MDKILDQYFRRTYLSNLLVIAELALPWVYWWAWNTLAHDVFGLPAIEQWFQAFALAILVAAIKPHKIDVMLVKP